MKTIEPYFESIPNPIQDAPFSHYEVQTVREYQDDQAGESFVEPIFEPQPEYVENASGPFFGIYGRFRKGGAEHIADRNTLEEAHDLLRSMGLLPL
jgi:hypothetical protein